MRKDALEKLLDGAGGLTGVLTEPLELETSFLDLAARFSPTPGTVVLLSGGDLDCARHHLMGVLPWLTLEGRSGSTRLTVEEQVLDVEIPPFEALRRLTRRFRLPAEPWPAPVAAGLMGYLAYDLKDDLERLPRTSVDLWQLPHMLLFAPSVLVIHHREEGTTRLAAPIRSVHGREGAEAAVRRFRDIAAAPPPAMERFAADAQGLRSNFTPEAYQAAVGRVIDYIAAGDVYQVNLSQRFQVPCRGDAFELFGRLFAQNPAPFFAYVQAGDHQVVSTSPERFLQCRGVSVEARPIKGTRPRGKTAGQDRRLREELAASPKDDAELSMIVDLMRNDIGRVCAPGSVEVAEHKRLEAYENVYHLVSVVRGRLDQGRDAVDLLEATFPGGSITGCPKVRTMEIIDELESARRHVYCGSLGYIGFDDNLDLSIAIRTATILNGRMSFSVGGGIVYDSDPVSEYEETLHKGRTLLSACEAEAPLVRQAMVWYNGRIVPTDAAAVPVTDEGLLYGNGFFETLRADRGRVPLLQGHLERFRRTWRDLMPSPPPDLTWGTVIDQVLRANGLEGRCAAVKILATRGSRTAAPWDHTLLVSARPYTHRLQSIGAGGLHLGTYPHPRQSPLAVHKTLNYLYYLRAGQWARRHAFHEALILNPDESLSETNTANLLLIAGRQVLRPDSPAVLEGVMARAACRQLAVWGYEIVRRPLFAEALFDGRQVLAANALMGIVPVAAVDGRPVKADDRLWLRLNDELIPGWQG